MNRAVRLGAAVGLLTLSYINATEAEVALSLWIASFLVFAVTALLDDKWQYLTVLLSLPLLYALYTSGSRDALTLAAFGLFSLLNFKQIALGFWALAAVLFLAEGFFAEWHLNTLPFLLLGLAALSAEGRSKAFLPAAYSALYGGPSPEETAQLKRENAYLRGQLEKARGPKGDQPTGFGRELKEITSNLAVLLFEVSCLVEESVLRSIPVFAELKDQLQTLQKRVPEAFSEGFFKEPLSAVLDGIALEKEAVFHLKLKKTDLTAGEKFVMGELTKTLVEKGKEYEITLSDGKEGLLYTVRPAVKKQLDERVEKLVDGIKGSVIFGDGSAYLIWRTETHEGTLDSTA